MYNVKLVFGPLVKCSYLQCIPLKGDTVKLVLKEEVLNAKVKDVIHCFNYLKRSGDENIEHEITIILEKDIPVP